MKTIENLKEGDYIAFMWAYMRGNEKNIEVVNITSVGEEDVLVHFLYSHHSIGERIKKKDILYIGDAENGTEEIKGWGGKYTKVKEELK